jgi:hypothetical protein
MSKLMGIYFIFPFMGVKEFLWDDINLDMQVL